MALGIAGIGEELTGTWHPGGMPTGRYTGHRAPSVADKARIARANRTAADLAPVLAELRAAGITKLNDIAAARACVPTPPGSGHWHAAQVSRVLKRLAE
jgi:hypothetical protein